MPNRYDGLLKGLKLKEKFAFEWCSNGWLLINMSTDAPKSALYSYIPIGQALNDATMIIHKHIGCGWMQNIHILRHIKLWSIN